jgi:hypothetical protein
MMDPAAGSRLRRDAQPASHGKPSALGTSGSFSAPVGSRVVASDPRSYYIDLRSKAISPDQPPVWYRRGSPRPHVALRLHINQLRAMALIDADPRFGATADRFERYASSSRNVAQAYSLKVLFRVAVPRNRWLAHRLPWSRDR